MDYSPKKIYFLVGALVLAALALVLVIFFTREDSQTEKEKIIAVSDCPKQIIYQGTVYPGVQIGEQCWLARNLKVLNYRDGTPIAHLTGSTAWNENQEGAYTCYDNLESQCDNYGSLYNWYAVNNEKGLCPEGWSVPTHQQWLELERTVCQDLGYQNCQEHFPNTIVSGWKGVDEGWNLLSDDSGGADKYEFGAIFGGYRNPSGPFSFLDEKGFWWTSTPSEEFAVARVIDKNHQSIRWIKSNRSSGFSVRCVRD